MENFDRKQRLAELICDEIKKEFGTVHYSGNLAATLRIEKTDKGWSVEIPARVYDMLKFEEFGEISYVGTESYASEIDKTGGFSGKHKGYIERCVKRAIYRWMQENQLQGKVR